MAEIRRRRQTWTAGGTLEQGARGRKTGTLPHITLDRWGREGAAVVGVRPRRIREQSRSCRFSGLEKDWAAEIAWAVWRGVTMAVAGGRSPEEVDGARGHGSC